MHNPEEAQRQKNELTEMATQDLMRAILQQDGPHYCCQVASRMGMEITETRWHLEQMRKRGEIDCKLGRYSV